MFVLVGSGYIFVTFNHGVEYFPEDIPPKQILVDIEAPEGTRIEFTDALAGRLEGEIEGIPGRIDVESVVTTVGSSGGGVDLMGGGGPGGPHAGRITLGFIDFQDRSHDAFATLAFLQENLGRDLAGANVSVEPLQEDPSQGEPVTIEIVGEDPEVLQDLSDRALAHPS